MSTVEHDITTRSVPRFDARQLTSRYAQPTGHLGVLVGNQELFQQYFSTMAKYALGVDEVFDCSGTHTKISTETGDDPHWMGKTTYSFDSDLVHQCAKANREFFRLRRDGFAEAIKQLKSDYEEYQSGWVVTPLTFWDSFTADDKWAEFSEKLDSFARLLTGWDGYTAPAPDRVAVNGARKFLEVAQRINFAPDRVKPSVVGGIGITFRKVSRKCYVEFYNNGTVYALFSDGESEPLAHQIRPLLSEYEAVLKDARDYLNG